MQSAGASCAFASEARHEQRNNISTGVAASAVAASIDLIDGSLMGTGFLSFAFLCILE